MKVGMLVASVSRRGGGIHEVVRRSALEMHRRGLSSVHVFGLGDECVAEAQGAWSPLEVHVFRPRGYRPFGYAQDLLPALRSAALDVLHNHGLWMYPSVAALKWSGLTKKPYVISVHGMLDAWAVGHSSWKKTLADLLYEHQHLRKASCLHALCSSEVDAIRRYGLSNPVCLIPCGVDVPALERVRNDRQEKVLLFLGRLHPKKGLVNLLAAWRSLLHDHASAADWHLWIAGWDQGGHEADLQRWTNEQGLQASVRFVGPQFGADKERLLRSADAFVLPSFSEGLPVSVLEAWAYGLPVVMTPQCNLPQGLAAGAAVSVDTTVPAIARGLLDVMTMADADRSVMGMRGRQLVEKQFSWAAYAEHMHSVYAWMTGAGPRPGCVVLHESRQCVRS